MAGWRVFFPIMALIFLLIAGTIIYHSIEGWNYLDSIYFSVATVTTIGYGDFSPKTDAGKIFTIIFAFSGIGIAFYIMSSIGRYLLRRQIKDRLELLGRIKNERGIKKIRRKS